MTGADLFGPIGVWTIVYLWQALVPPQLAAAPVVGGVLGPEFWLSSLGTFGVFLVLFAETGLLIGVFLPGDSLLFTARACSARAPHTARPPGP